MERDGSIADSRERNGHIDHLDDDSNEDREDDDDDNEADSNGDDGEDGGSEDHDGQEEGEDLYAIKWYKDNEEFYRYVPKANPPKTSYRVDGVRVIVSMNYYCFSYCPCICCHCCCYTLSYFRKEISFSR